VNVGTIRLRSTHAPDEALAELAKVEDPASPVRIIISVGMLKEGWDVRNVYVIASMRSSVSEILTEQTLGRGMRLPFGQYSEIEILDTLEVVAHERYQDLLKKAGVLNQAFVDYPTRAVLRTNAQSQQVAVIETVTSTATPVLESEDSPPPLPGDGEPAPVVTTVEQRSEQAEAAAAALKQEVARRTDVAPIMIPVLRMSTVRSSVHAGRHHRVRRLPQARHIARRRPGGRAQPHAGQRPGRDRPRRHEASMPSSRASAPRRSKCFRPAWIGPELDSSIRQARGARTAPCHGQAHVPRGRGAQGVRPSPGD